MNKPNRSFSIIEPLEARIAPATITATTATWIDVDGDAVTLKIKKGNLSTSAIFDFENSGLGEQLQGLDLRAVSFLGTSITVTAVRSALGGDGSVNIGYINAAGNTLAAVKIAGDLTRIDAGLLLPLAKSKPAIASLNVQSMGAVGDTNLDPSVLSLTSEISGNLGALVVRGDFNAVKIHVFAATPVLGSIKSISIGEIVGNDEAESGSILATGNIGAIKVRGNILGGAGAGSGVIEAGGNITSFSILGSIFGGKSELPTTANSGVIKSGGKMGKVSIGGSLIGGTQQNSGVIDAGTDLGPVLIKGSVVGGTSGTLSGAIVAGGNFKSIVITGDLQGGAAEKSGYLHSDGNGGVITIGRGIIGGSALMSGMVDIGTNLTNSLTSIKVGTALQGGSGVDSGVIASSGLLKSVTIGGSLFGGSNNNTGVIRSGGDIAKLTILGNMVGGDLNADALDDLENSAYIQANRILSLAINGSIQSGVNYSTFDSANNAAIRSANDILKLTVKGSLVGNATNEILITARGQTGILTDTDLAIGSVTIGGTVRYTQILAGYNLASILTLGIAAAESNADAQIGAVKVTGDWIASDLVAGVSAGVGGQFGTGNDVKIVNADDPDIFSKIASINIKGSVRGTDSDLNNLDNFGFVAQLIGPDADPLLILPLAPTPLLTVGLTKLSLKPGKGNDNTLLSVYQVGATGDVFVFEAPIP